MLLLGITDTPYEGDPGAVVPDAGDETFLLDAASSLLPPELLRPQKVRYSFAGLRVLPFGDEETSRASREHVISVGGGKLTTHRLIACDALRRRPTGLRPRKLRPNSDPLPDVYPPPDVRARLASVLPETAAR